MSSIRMRRHVVDELFDFDRLTNGFAEGVNNKIKPILRRAFGFSKFESLRLHILIALESTPLHPVVGLSPSCRESRKPEVAR